MVSPESPSQEPSPENAHTLPEETGETDTASTETSTEGGDTATDGGKGPDEEESAEAEGDAPKRSWLSRLRQALSRSSNWFSDGLTNLFRKRRLDDDTLEELEELLIQADLGVSTASHLTAALAKGRYDKEISAEEVKAVLAEEITAILAPVAHPLAIRPAKETGHPHVVLVVGVNGSGKTTTIGKLARHYRKQEKLKVVLAAGDTFRAAAVEQLKIWGERAKCPVIARDTGADAAGLAYDALQHAQQEKTDLLLIDTAGRLHNKSDLMAELQKIIRVLKKLDETAPHTVLLVLDATIGQNAHAQLEAFRDLVQVSGLALTKLDGTARGGVVIALADKFKLPIHAIGVGEGMEDLKPFEAEAFARFLLGLEELKGKKK